MGDLAGAEQTSVQSINANRRAGAGDCGSPGPWVQGPGPKRERSTGGGGFEQVGRWLGGRIQRVRSRHEFPKVPHAVVVRVAIRMGIEVAAEGDAIGESVRVGIEGSRGALELVADRLNG